MAMNNRDRVGKAFDLLSEGLHDVVDQVMTAAYSTADWTSRWAEEDAQRRGGSARTLTKHDVQVQLRAVTEQGYRFKDVLSRAQQGFASELRETRNLWAHNEPFSSDDASRALDTIERLLHAVGSVDSAEDVRKLRVDLQRTVFEDQTRKQVKRTRVSLDPGSGLRPWREVIRPHNDVARGEFTASEFAADLHLVHTGQAASPEYGNPVEFFTRTYLTEGLHDLLARALRRLNGDANSSPVVNLQTNFGGGKTHSMLALYHLFSGTPANELPQELQELVAENGNPDLASLGVKRVALVGTYLKAGSPIIKDDGTAVCTLWGELAWQLGGREAYDLIAEDDRAGTNPGEALRTLIQRYSPALILIDEWVAYARQLVTDKELPAGSFETQFTFAQSLTEVVRSVPGTMLVVSIPASDTGDAGRGSDIEVGGANGQLALERLQNVIRRVADQWRPSSKDESFEIVRRRLFQAPNADGLTTIAAVARSFVTLYRNNTSLFPRDAATPSDDYEKRIRASYPLHPELLDRLYEDWSTLERFQRTRGVLKLVSSIVHELWASKDTAPLILPGTVPLDATTVNTDLTQYLEDQWKPIIDSDIDGQGSTAQQIDLDRPNLGQRFVTQRIARTIFMGAAPRIKSTRKGLDKQYVWLGTAVPDDTLGNFGSALELLAQRSTYFYEEQGHYWFDTQPSVTKTANDYAERLREDVETVWNEISRRLQSEERSRGVFDRVHIAPASSADIPDLEDTRLVIAHPRHSRRKADGAEAAAHQWIQDAIETKGASQRIHRNTLVFLLADKSELESLEAATRSYLGWKRVQATGDSLNLSAQQRKQTDDWVARLDQTVSDRIRDAYVWTVYPEQFDPTKPFELIADKTPSSGGRSLAERVASKLGREDQLVTDFGAPILGATLHQELAARWHETGEITAGELWGYFTRYVYLPRLVRREVLDSAIVQALSTVLVDSERFAIASGKDLETGRYRGLLVPPSPNTTIQVTDSTLLIDVKLAQEQIDAQQALARSTASTTASEIYTADVRPADSARPGDGKPSTTDETTAPETLPDAVLARFFGSVKIDSDRYSRDIGNVTREIIDRLSGAGASLEITIDIQATKPEGFDDSEVRTITENARVLKFDPSSGFERY
ncbi:Swt1 family HEPN domain-containing protein (plasmid) [Paenarthrobacter sp. AT5]|uniref:Swt1 family HEPN domain-containing protein n=1 Tax=Paenarthrobacter sp. AT5 TaxID=2973089 RepID=UPI0029347A38|nr:Swt1 family HEPN domain-containing protein [Paenarthrobacter sp. AT5]WOC63396.1 Swt1 family HEPN domain-containing protein [Paenarthrobacter sp. AT5]